MFLPRSESRTGRNPFDGITWTVQVWNRPWPLSDWLVQATSEDIPGLKVREPPASHKSLHKARVDASWLYATCMSALLREPWKPDKISPPR
jgi:hypothetical protein